jgi:hypothetical protein
LITAPLPSPEPICPKIDFGSSARSGIVIAEAGANKAAAGFYLALEHRHSRTVRKFRVRAGARERPRLARTVKRRGRRIGRREFVTDAQPFGRIGRYSYAASAHSRPTIEEIK